MSENRFMTEHALDSNGTSFFVSGRFGIGSCFYIVGDSQTFSLFSRVLLRAKAAGSKICPQKRKFALLDRL